MIRKNMMKNIVINFIMFLIMFLIFDEIMKNELKVSDSLVSVNVNEYMSACCESR